MKRFTVVCFPLVVLALSLGLNSAKGAVITFSPLPGPTDAPYGGHTEAGFTITPISGSWFQALLYGNPAPSVYDGPIGSPDTAALQVTDTVLPFTFSSVDYSSNNGTSTFLIEGFRGGPMVFSDAGTLAASIPPGFGFSTLSSGHPSTLIDRLVIQVTPGNGVSSINLDNINVTKTPEPGTMLLLSTALCILAKREKQVKNT
jgi:hypothetical protein